MMDSERVVVEIERRRVRERVVGSIEREREGELERECYDK